MFCSGCGRQAAADARFCAGCGAPLATAPSRTGCWILLALGVVLTLIVRGIIVALVAVPAPPAPQRAYEPPPIPAPVVPEPPALAPAPVVKETAPVKETPAPRRPAAEKSVVLDVKASSWRSQGPLDVRKALTSELANAGVAVVLASGAPDGVVTVTYEESEGRKYQFDGQEESSTDMKLELSLTRADSELLGFKIEVTPSDHIVATSLNAASSDMLQGDELYARAGVLVAAALGVRSALPRLVTVGISKEFPEPHVPHELRYLDKRTDGDVSRIVLALLERNAFEPASATERAALLVQHSDWSGCAAIGPAAVDVIAGYVERTAASRFDDEAALALGKIGTPALPAVRSLLEHCLTCFAPGGPEGLIKILADMGDRADLPLLDRLARREVPQGMNGALVDDDVVEAAGAAARTIRARTGAPPPPGASDSK
jgi:hypothetical protein